MDQGERYCSAFPSMTQLAKERVKHATLTTVLLRTLGYTIASNPIDIGNVPYYCSDQPIEPHSSMSPSIVTSRALDEECAGNDWREDAGVVFSAYGI